MRQEAQRRVTEDGGWQVQVQATSRLTALCASRGSGERVQERGARSTNATDGGGGRIEGENEKIQKTG